MGRAASGGESNSSSCCRSRCCYRLGLSALSVGLAWGAGAYGVVSARPGPGFGPSLARPSGAGPCTLCSAPFPCRHDLSLVRRWTAARKLVVNKACTCTAI